MTHLTYSDMPTLRGAGFKAGPTGYAWYCKDIVGDVWRAYEDPCSDNMLFSVEVHGKWGPTKPMTLEEFYDIFTNRAE